MGVVLVWSGIIIYFSVINHLEHMEVRPKVIGNKFRIWLLKLSYKFISEEHF